MTWKRLLLAVALAALVLAAGSQVYADAWPTSPITAPNDPGGPGV